MGVNQWFKNFHSNVYMDSTTVEKIKLRYRNITKRINQEYWESESDTSHSLYVGSYGRGTAIYTSDIDIIVELPYSVKNRFDQRLGNVQSQLLTEVKEKLKKTYSTSKVSADGQVIVINFSDGIKFEVVPVFKIYDDSYFYPDTNAGGSWEIMDPRKEMEEFNFRHRNKNYNLKKFCRMVRAWREEHRIIMSGELLDTIVYDFFGTASYVDKDAYLYFDYITRDFFKYLSENAHKKFFTPGTLRALEIEYPYSTSSNAKKMNEKALDAILKEKNMPYTAKLTWGEIYGRKFTK